MKNLDVEINSIINKALGEASAIFMSQKIKGTNIIMPTEKLIEISNKTTAKIGEYLYSKAKEIS